MSKPIINIYWFKRDLRIFDNVPFQLSCDEEYPTLLIFLFEPELVNNAHHSERHWNFIKESNKKISRVGCSSSQDNCIGTLSIILKSLLNQ